jgi:NAD(P)-dependent dehydrogenase (short-subunit alcohol dehydrogenase family)
LSNTVVFVTGAASGIGRASALRLASEFAAVVLVDRDADGCAETEKSIGDAGGHAITLVADVADEASVARAMKQTIADLGGLNAAVNCAGISAGLDRGLLAELDAEAFDRMIAINLRGVFLCMKHQLATMAGSRTTGSIVNVASGAGLVGLSHCSAYVASKHGVVGLTKAAAIEYAPLGIRVNAVCPGVVRTPMADQNPRELAEKVLSRHPLGRMAEASEIAEAIVWLCSPLSSNVTGIAMPVDGGYVAQ